jgi:cytochrome c oxidase subunit 2
MDPQPFELFPQSASSVSDRVDSLYLFLVAISVLFTALICVLILFFAIRYRRGSKAKRAHPPQSMALEITWAAIPLLLTMVMFAWGAWIYYDMRTPPQNAMPISVVGKQWMWKVQHPEGAAEINTLHLPVGQPVRLTMISEDVIHSFYIPAFRVKQDVLPGYYTSLWFTPTRPGVYHLFCAEYCGTEHSHMRGRIVVMPPADYARWLSENSGEPASVAGRRHFERFRCAGCHNPGAARSGPLLAGLYRSQVPLANGRAVVADDQYLRDSIRNPSKHLVAGHQPLMPNYKSEDLDESRVMQLIAYIKTLTPGTEKQAP